MFDAQFHPFMENTIVTCGVKHIKFWTLCGKYLIDYIITNGKAINVILSSTYHLIFTIYSWYLHYDVIDVCVILHKYGDLEIVSLLFDLKGLSGRNP